MLGSRMQSHLQLRVQILKGAAPSVFEYMLSILPPELPGTCHRKSTPTLHRFGRTLAQGFYVDVHVGHPRRIRKLGWENPGHGPKGLSGIQYRHPYSKYPYSKSTLAGPVLVLTGGVGVIAGDSVLIGSTPNPKSPPPGMPLREITALTIALPNPRPITAIPAWLQR